MTSVNPSGDGYTLFFVASFPVDCLGIKGFGAKWLCRNDENLEYGASVGSIYVRWRHVHWIWGAKALARR